MIVVVNSLGSFASHASNPEAPICNRVGNRLKHVGRRETQLHPESPICDQARASGVDAPILK